MSGLGAAALRELDAVPRTFRTVKGALLWYRDELMRRVRCKSSHLDAPTFSAVLFCLKEHHPADEIGRGLAYVPYGRWKNQPRWGPGEAILWLVAWYENTADDGTDMAEEAGLEMKLHRDPDANALALRAGLQRRAFQRRCEATARKMRLRLVHAGLIDDTKPPRRGPLT